MQIFLNGESQETNCQNLLQLIQELSLEGKRFAVEMNEMIISKSKLQHTPISEQDRIEIIQAVGGG
ncbi:sulfur carrier protein ThiS [Acinetobacter rongchengensis]|uniref:Sulfur carrier protein ThiS n=1 Tax=Acinetobacter rongchengensis TaxID=2419601 RepID=A0A3A8ETV4_9GAMM|nr:sulfur carrier protein ThiS [Acinetobacter rongchengensis]RKG38287.1 sulfur carrier protein ThiS [Acinetobacter rongchengensis]